MPLGDERTHLCAIAKDSSAYGAAESPSGVVSDRTEEEHRHLRNAVLLQFLTLSVAVNVIGPFLPIEAIQLHIHEKALGVVFAASPLSVALVSPLAGWACSVAGSFRLLGCSILAVMALNVATAAVPSAMASSMGIFYALVALRAMMGAAMALSTNAVVTGLAPIFPTKMGLINGQMETCVGVGYAVGTTAGGFLYGLGGWSLPFLCAAALQLVVGAVTLPVLQRASRLETSLRLAGAQRAEDEPPPEQAAAWTHLLCWAYAFPIGTVFLAAVAFSVSGPVLPVFWADHGLSVEVVGALQASMAMMYAVFCLFWGHLSEKVNPHCLAAGGLLVAGLGYGLIASDNMVLSGSVYALWGIVGSGIIVPTMPAILQAVQPGGPTAVGLAVGIEEAAYFCGEVVGPIVGVWAQSAVGLPSTLTYISVVMLAFSVTYILWLISVVTITRTSKPLTPNPTL